MSHFERSETWWYTGVVLTPERIVGDGEVMWSVVLKFLDDGFCDMDSTEGELRLRYQIPTQGLSAAIDTLLADAKRMGLAVVEPDLDANSPTVYVKGDGEWSGIAYPDNWRDIVNGQAARLGWKPTYKTEKEDET